MSEKRFYILKKWDEWRKRTVYWVSDFEYPYEPRTIRGQPLIFISRERARHYVENLRVEDLDNADVTLEGLH